MCLYKLPMNSPCGNRPRSIGRPWRPIFWTCIYPDALMLIWRLPLVAVLNSSAWPWSLASARTVPVTADACCRAACHVAQWQRVCFQGCEEAGRLEEKWVVFIFMCWTNCVPWAFSSPAAADVTACRGVCLTYPPTCFSW